jgi:hypothetical protein
MITPSLAMSVQYTEEVEEFMKKNTNHQKISDFCKENPDSLFNVDYQTALMCFGYAVQHQYSPVVIKRLFGKVRSLRKILETSILDQYLEMRQTSSSDFLS